MSLWSKLRGTIETIFQVGLGGPQVKGNAGALEVRNAADSGFAIARGAEPVGDHDLATKQYVDTLTTRTTVTAQFDGNNALPANTGVEHFYVVTTTGANASIGQLLWDDGQGIGTVLVLTAASRAIYTASAFSGGTITFPATCMAFWDTATSTWIIEASATFSGAQRTIRYAITNAASQDSATQIPANAFVSACNVEVVTPFSGGSTISVGRAGSTTLIQLATDNLSTVAGNYEVDQDTGWGGAPFAVRTTVGGAPAAGAGFVVVKFSVPDA